MKRGRPGLKRYLKDPNMVINTIENIYILNRFL